MNNVFALYPVIQPTDKSLKARGGSTPVCLLDKLGPLADGLIRGIDQGASDIVFGLSAEGVQCVIRVGGSVRDLGLQANREEGLRALLSLASLPPERAARLFESPLDFGAALTIGDPEELSIVMRGASCPVEGGRLSVALRLLTFVEPGSLGAVLESEELKKSVAPEPAPPRRNDEARRL